MSGEGSCTGIISPIMKTVPDLSGKIVKSGLIKYQVKCIVPMEVRKKNKISANADASRQPSHL